MTDAGNRRMVDRWFPVAAVDEACGTTAGSGLTEKAVFTWFASRPIAQARAAALTSLLPDDERLRPMVEKAIRTGDSKIMEALAKTVVETNSGTAPVVLDMFSGRAIIALEAARAGADAIGIDLSQVATLAGRLLADYPARDWSAEPRLPFSGDESHPPTLPAAAPASDRLAGDLSCFLSEVDRRVVNRVQHLYPRNERGVFPWGYLWTVTLPCDKCKRRFPLFGALVVRLPQPRHGDPGQSIQLTTNGDGWSAQVIDGPPTQPPTYTSAIKPDGKLRKGKAARCLFCHHTHPLEAVKAKCANGEQEDALVGVMDTDASDKRFFRLPTKAERTAVEEIPMPDYGWPYPSLPDEVIPSGNVHAVMASGYGYLTFGAMMVRRQARTFVETVQSIRELHTETINAGVSQAYAAALASLAASNLCRRLRRSTRGAVLDLSRGGVGHIFVNECSVNFSFDSFETGPGSGAGTWDSVSQSSVRAMRKVVKEKHGRPARLLRASASALPRRDKSVDVIITDPPYYDMIEYADASDIFHVWLKRVLFDIEPDLFGPDVQQPDGLQDKNQEIIVRRVHEPNRVRHDREFYETMLARSFSEARRVLRENGHLVVVFGHSDPDAWRRLLGALQTAGFVVTSAWPSRTETNNAKVASIKVTVTIGCRVAGAHRPLGIAADVDREVAEAVTERARQWDADGLAIEDQLMASYGPAMEVYGRYSRVITPDGSDADLDRYLTISRRAVRDAMRLRVDELPIETFDAVTRFAVFWLRAKGRIDVPKGEARFFAQADELRLEALREHVLVESKAGFRLRLDDPGSLTPLSSLFEVVRGMASAWHRGGTQSVAAVVAQAGRDADDQQLWAVVAELSNQLPPSDQMATALAGIKRSTATIGTLVGGARQTDMQARLFDTSEGR